MRGALLRFAAFLFVAGMSALPVHAQVDLVPCAVTTQASPHPAGAALLAAPLVPHAAPVQPLVGNVAELHAATALVGTFVPLNLVLGRPALPMQQVDVENAIKQAVKNAGAVQFSSAERLRQQASGRCDKSLRELGSLFEQTRDTFGYPPRDTAGLADFPDWYFGGTATQEQQQRAAAVVAAERKFEQDCMATTIPPEMNPTLVRQAVGILAVDNTPFCSALRVAADRIQTDKHCFLQPTNGARWPVIDKVIAGQARLWFAYEAEPNRFFEVCKEDLPPSESKRITPNIDHVELTIAATAAPVAPLKWVAPELSGGTSLYLRGFFPFASGATILDHMRATAAGGCAALAVQGRCVFHGCQSLSGMSGSPLFVRPDGPEVAQELRVAALHVGPANLANGNLCVLDGNDVGRSNLGYQP